MSYQPPKRERDRQNFENWHRYGKERGFFERVADTFASWFGDENDEQRYNDPQRSRMGTENEYWQRYDAEQIPEWQRANYSGSSPRGSRLEESGRFEEPEFPPAGGRYGRRVRANEGGKQWQPAERSWGNESRYTTSQRPRFFERNRWEENRQPTGFEQWHDSDEERGYGSWSSYRGRGPRNYKRSDEQIVDEIHRILTFHPEIDATDVDVAVEASVVTLRGAVDSRRAKRLAEDLVEEVFGVREVHNELRVNRGDFQRPLSQSERDRTVSR